MTWAATSAATARQPSTLLISTAWLPKAFARETTLVTFMADHGLAMPRAKCTLYDPGIEVALIMRSPRGEITGGRVYPQLVGNVDVLPTLLAAAGVPIPERVQGRSFLRLVRGEPYVPRTAVYAEKTFHSYYDPMRAVRTERFKYIRNFETAFEVEVPADVELGAIFRSHVELYHNGQHPPAELYELEVDPLEQTNVAGDPRYAGVAFRLDLQLWTWMEDTQDPLLQGPVVSPAYRQARRGRIPAIER
jgi:arylsulfatase A-like enzyme